MNSEQERLIALFSETITGAPLIFAPDNFKIKHKEREPADLVWELNDCIILFYMTGTEPEQNSWGRKHRIDKQIQHNLRQASRWLGYWKGGINLKGKNNYRAFDIPYDPNRKIIIFSIYRIGINHIHYHDEFAKYKKVALCVSLPEIAIEVLSKLKATPFDICFLLKEMKKSGLFNQNNLFDNDAGVFFKNLFVSIANSVKQNHPEVDPSNINVLLESMSLFRNSHLVSTKISSDKFEHCYFSNDISTRDLLSLVSIMEEEHAKHRKDDKIYGTMVVPMVHYKVVFTYCHAGNLALASPAFLQVIEDSKTNNEDIFGIMIIKLAGNEYSTMYMVHPVKSSQLYGIL